MWMLTMTDLHLMLTLVKSLLHCSPSVHLLIWLFCWILHYALCWLSGTHRPGGANPGNHDRFPQANAQYFSSSPNPMSSNSTRCLTTSSTLVEPKPFKCDHTGCWHIYSICHAGYLHSHGLQRMPSGSNHRHRCLDSLLFLKFTKSVTPLLPSTVWVMQYEPPCTPESYPYHWSTSRHSWITAFMWLTKLIQNVSCVLVHSSSHICSLGYFELTKLLFAHSIWYMHPSGMLFPCPILIQLQEPNRMGGTCCTWFLECTPAHPDQFSLSMSLTMR